MEYHAVTSSNIEAIGYDPQTNTLGVRFKGGAEYQYPDISRQEYEDLKLAGSVGSHFHRHIRHRNNSRI